MLILRNIIILAATFIALGFGQTSYSSELPAAPEGLKWYKSTNGVGTFLHPANWNILEEENKGTNALFISRENIKEQGAFITGLAVNQVTLFSKHNTIKPSIYAKAFIQKLIDNREVIKSGVVKGNVSDMNLVRYIGSNNGVKTIVHYIAIGLDDEDIVYLISFESPEKEWDAMYSYAKYMLNYFALGK